MILIMEAKQTIVNIDHHHLRVCHEFWPRFLSLSNQLRQFPIILQRFLARDIQPLRISIYYRDVLRVAFPYRPHSLPHVLSIFVVQILSILQLFVFISLPAGAVHNSQYSVPTTAAYLYLLPFG